MGSLPLGTSNQLRKQNNWYYSFHIHKSKLKQGRAFIINWFLEVLSWYFSPKAYIKVVSFNVETSSFQFTSLQALGIKADLACDPWLSTYFLEVMLSALIHHQDLRVLLWEDKLGNQTIKPFGLHWDLPEQEHLSPIPLWPVIVSIWRPLLRLSLDLHMIPERLTCVRILIASNGSCGEAMETKGSIPLYIIFPLATILFHAETHVLFYYFDN